MAKCDLCNQTCPGHQLAELRERYQIPGVIDVCPECERWTNKLKSDLLDQIAPKMREAIAEKKGKPLTKTNKALRVLKRILTPPA